MQKKQKNFSKYKMMWQKVWENFRRERNYDKQGGRNIIQSYVHIYLYILKYI